MQVKDVLIKTNLKVVDPTSGLVGYYKGDFEYGVFLGENKEKMKRVFPIVTSKEDFLDWQVAEDKEKITIRNLIK